MADGEERARGGWERLAAVAARTAHLGAMAVLVGGLWFAAPDAPLRDARHLTLATGIVLLALEASHSRHWAYQGRGVAAVLHAAAALLLVGAGGRGAAAAALVVGAAGSHLPRSFRKWSFRHGRVVD
jgi:hypothetical protein